MNKLNELLKLVEDDADDAAEKMVANLEKKKGEKYPPEEREKMLDKFRKNLE